MATCPDSAIQIKLGPIPQIAQPIQLCIRSPHQTPPSPPRPPPTNLKPTQLNNQIRHNPHKPRTPLPPPRPPQPLHSPPIILRRKMTLRTILMHNIRQPHTHNENRQRGRRAPVHVDAMRFVIGCGLEIDKAAGAGPGAGHAVAGLVGAKGLGEDDVGETARVGDIAGADDEVFGYVAEGLGAEPGQVVGGPFCRGEVFLEVVSLGEVTFDPRSDSGEGLVFCVGCFVGEPPD